MGKFSYENGGGGGIRTHGGLTPTAVFKTAAFNRSATPPHSSIRPWRRPPGCGRRRAPCGRTALGIRRSTSLCLKARELPFRTQKLDFGTRQRPRATNPSDFLNPSPRLSLG